MIRFRTIDPAEAAKSAEKPAAKAEPAKAAPVAPAPVAAEPEADASAKPKGKGLTRKTPLRAKKPEPAKLFDT